MPAHTNENETRTPSTHNTISTLNGQWPSDTWFRRAIARKLKAQAQELESEASNDNCNYMSKVQS